MAKQTLEQWLNNHPEVTECYVIGQKCFNPYTGQPWERQNLIFVKDWQKYRSYQTFSKAKVLKIEDSSYREYPTIYVKIPKKILRQEIIELLL